MKAILVNGTPYTQQQVNAVLSFGEQHPAFKLFFKSNFVVNPQKYSHMVRVTDSGEETFCDRYTVYIKDLEGWEVYTMSERPLSPLGINMYSHTKKRAPRSISLNKVPKEVLQAISQRLCE